LETVFVEPAPRLAVSVEGSGELVLFLHGIRGNRRNWNPQLEVFSKRYRAAAWDARGYGDSDDYEGPLQFDHFLGDVLRVAEHFRAPKFHLVGLSMGGRIARNFALRYPDRLRSLTLINTTPGFDALSSNDVRRFVTERSKPDAQVIRSLLSSKARPEALGELTDSLSRLRQMSFVKTLQASVAQDRSAPISNIRVPTLVIVADEDSVYPVEIARDMAARIPGSELAIIHGAGHLSNLEQPEQFNKAVMDFLTKQDQRS
jgi:3-oxoadipate enol-lactonase